MVTVFVSMILLCADKWRTGLLKTEKGGLAA